MRATIRKRNGLRLRGEGAPLLRLGNRAVDYLESRRERENISVAVQVALVMFLTPLILMAAVLIYHFKERDALSRREMWRESGVVGKGHPGAPQRGGSAQREIFNADEGAAR